MEKPLTPLNEERIGKPYVLYDGSFILEVLKPHPSRNASSMLRATYKANHPLSKLGFHHPQTPPLHIHFSQVESFQVLTGSLYTITGYSQTPIRRTPQNTPADIPTMTPHRFHVDPKGTEDCTMIVWCNPQDVKKPLDDAFFVSLLCYVSDIHEKKAKMDLLQIMLLQHQNESPLIMFPGAWWLGPLRYLIPYYAQATLANIALLLGKKPIMSQYVSEADLKAFEKGHKSN